MKRHGRFIHPNDRSRNFDLHETNTILFDVINAFLQVVRTNTHLTKESYIISSTVLVNLK